ncbi:MAG: hypothetical protein J5642_06125 [Bacteroidales bacterium]|nr:hypothetical protein [Bacteroidales bacterium]
MKIKFLFIAALAVAVAFTSCKSKTTEKQDKDSESTEMSDDSWDSSDDGVITVETTEPTVTTPEIEVELPDQLKDNVEVIRVSKKVDEINYAVVTITFKLLNKVDPKPLCNKSGNVNIVGVGQDEDGVDVEELLGSLTRTWFSEEGLYEKPIFNEFLESEPGETLTLRFDGEPCKGANTRAELEKVKKFKLKIKK